MRRGLVILANVAALLALAALSANAQSLADAARHNRMNKPAATASQKVYTNDNLPTSGALSTTAPTAAEQPSIAAREKPAAPAKDAKAEAQAKAELDRLEAEWRGRFKKQRVAITLLEREIAGLDRELKLRPAAVACSYGTLCADKAANEQQLQQEKQKLEDMKDELRKAELPDSWAE